MLVETTGNKTEITPVPGKASETTSRRGELSKLTQESCVFELRPYQQRIIKNAMDGFRGGSDGLPRPAKSVLIVSPTGSGKMAIGLTIARELQQRRGPRAAPDGCAAAHPVAGTASRQVI